MLVQRKTELFTNHHDYFMGVCQGHEAVIDPRHFYDKN